MRAVGMTPLFPLELFSGREAPSARRARDRGARNLDRGARGRKAQRDGGAQVNTDLVSSAESMREREEEKRRLMAAKRGEEQQVG